MSYASLRRKEINYSGVLFKRISSTKYNNEQKALYNNGGRRDPGLLELLTCSLKAYYCNIVYLYRVLFLCVPSMGILISLCFCTKDI